MSNTCHTAVACLNPEPMDVVAWAVLLAMRDDSLDRLFASATSLGHSIGGNARLTRPPQESTGS